MERREAERAGAVKDTLIVTPLMDFVRQKRAAKGVSRVRQNFSYLMNYYYIIRFGEASKFENLNPKPGREKWFYYILRYSLGVYLKHPVNMGVVDFQGNDLAVILLLNSCFGRIQKDL